MSPRARQLFASATVGLFLIIAVLVTIKANGWHWAGWRQGFVSSGVVVISSTPRSTVMVDGKNVGSTPHRISGLAPGIYQLELRASGLQPWRQVVQVEAHQAVVIGPVLLLPTSVAASALPGAPNELITTDNGDRVFVSTTNASSLRFNQVWPLESHTTFSQPQKPEHLWVSPNSQLIAATTQSITSLFRPTQTEAPWTVPAISAVFWLPGSEQVVYGLREGQLWRFDSVAQTETVVGPATQAGAYEQDLWRTTIDNNQTVLWRQSSYGASTPREILRRAGIFTVTNGPNRVFILTENTTKETVVAIFPVNGLPKILELGTTSSVIWSEAGQRPLWVRDVEIWTLDTNGQTQLLDRRSVSPSQYGWLASPDIITTVDSRGLTISSVSARQGRGTLLTAPLSENQKVIGFKPDQREALISGPTGLDVWRW